MVVQGIAVINLIIAVIGCMSCLFSAFYIAFGIKKDMTTATLIFILSIFLLVRNLCIVFLQLTYGQHGPFWYYGIQLAGFGTFLYSILSSYMVPLFLLNKVTLSERTKRIIRIVLTIVLFLGLALILWAQFTGRLVQIDEFGMYQLGGMYYSAYMMTAVYMIFDLPLLTLYGDEIVPKQRLTLGIFIIMPLIATLGKPLYSEVHLATLFTSISLLLMVILIVDEDAKAFRQQEVLKEQLEIDLLLSQIQPHFLFNVLYVIQEICYIDPIKAASAIEDFSMYLRHNMDSISIRTPIPFKDELDHVKHYVSLQRLRFGDALNVQYDLECSDFNVPTLTLQPIVENAVRYGVRMAPKGKGKVVISTRENENSYEVDVVDNGPGFDANHVANDGMSHTGLKNVRERLKHVCGGELIVVSTAGKGTTVKMIIPKE